MNHPLYFRIALLIFLSFIFNAFGEESLLDAALRSRIDEIVQRALADTDAPSASISIVQDGRIAYARAYGKARLDPVVNASPEMRYSIGSISKQFTAAAILLLVEDKKLSLNDPVSKFIPGVTRGSEITVRQLLSHTSGIQDYWPQDYVPPFMKQDVNPDTILNRWARKALDFEPGTQYQYSNTGFVIAGLIIEKVSGMPLMQFLNDRIFKPLEMTSVLSVDRSSLPETDAAGYTRYGLGPLRIAPKEGKGWLFAAGELAMTPRDLARWNVAMIHRKLLKPESYQEMQTEILLKNGMGAEYGLGLGIVTEADHRAVEHGGAVSGFTSESIVFPDDRAAIVVLTNFDAAQAGSRIMQEIAPVLFATDETVTEAKRLRTLQIFEGLQRGVIDSKLFTENAKSYFTEQALKDHAESLTPLGKPLECTQTVKRERGGMTLRRYHLKFEKRELQVWVRDLPDGTIEEYQVFSAE